MDWWLTFAILQAMRESTEQSYVDELLHHLAKHRLQQAATIAAAGQLHVHEHMSGHHISFAGAAPDVHARFEEIVAGDFELGLHGVTQLSKPHVADSAADVAMYVKKPSANAPTILERVGLSDAPEDSADHELHFPEEALLTDTHIDALLLEMIPLATAYGATWAGPKDYPSRLTYPRVKRSFLSRRNFRPGAIAVNDGCTGDQVGCDWGAYCKCLTYCTKTDFIERGGDAKIPEDKFWNGEGDPFMPKRTQEELDNWVCKWHGEECGRW